MHMPLVLTALVLSFAGIDARPHAAANPPKPTIAARRAAAAANTKSPSSNSSSTPASLRISASPTGTGTAVISGAPTPGANSTTPLSPTATPLNPSTTYYGYSNLQVDSVINTTPGSESLAIKSFEIRDSTSTTGSATCKFPAYPSSGELPFSMNTNLPCSSSNYWYQVTARNGTNEFSITASHAVLDPKTGPRIFQTAAVLGCPDSQSVCPNLHTTGNLVWSIPAPPGLSVDNYISTP